MLSLHPVVKDDVEEIVRITKNELLLLENKHIVITGSLGMLGKYLMYTFLYMNEHLLKRPAKFHVIVRNKNYFFGKDKNIDYIVCNIAKETPSTKQAHYILHAASKSAPRIYTKHKTDTLNTNILGIYNLLKICNKNTKSILYFSSAEIYGSPKENMPVDENYIGTFDHLNNRSCYVEGKRAAETICMNYFFEKNIPVKIVRLFHTFGPGLNLHDGRAFSDFIKFGLHYKDIAIHGDGNLKRSYLYTKDATIMIIKIFLSNKNGEIFNVGNDKNVVSVEELALIICKIFNQMHKKKIRLVFRKKNNPYYSNAVKSIIPNIEKFKRYFSYTPDTDLETALRKTIQYLSD